MAPLLQRTAIHLTQPPNKSKCCRRLAAATEHYPENFPSRRARKGYLPLQLKFSNRRLGCKSGAAAARKSSSWGLPYHQSVFRPCFPASSRSQKTATTNTRGRGIVCGAFLPNHAEDARDTDDLLIRLSPLLLCS